MKKKSPEIDKEKNNKYLKLIAFLSNAGLKEKRAEVFQKTFYYFRGDQLFDLYSQNLKEIGKIFNEDFQENEEDFLNLGKRLIDDKIIVKLVRNQEDQKQKNKKKWPSRLIISPDQKVTKSDFYSWLIKVPNRWSTALLFGIIFGVIMLCVFPAWPYTMKKTVLDIMFWISGGALLLILSRYILAIILFILGVDLWIFPDLFSPDKGFFASFFPLYYIKLRKDSWDMLIVRICTLVILVLFCLLLSTQSRVISDLGDFGYNSVFELRDWGLKALEGNSSNSTFSRRFKPYDEILSSINDNSSG